MKTLIAILFLALGLPAQGAWVLDGITYNDCSGEYFATAIREGYCVEGGQFVADAFVEPPQLLEGHSHRGLIHNGRKTHNT